MSFFNKIFGEDKDKQTTKKLYELVVKLKNLENWKKPEKIALFKELGELGEQLGEPAIPILVDALSLSSGLGQWDLRSFMKVLGRFGEPAVEPLIMALSKRFGASTAHYILIEIGSPAVEPLIAALQSDNETTLYLAARALGKIGDSRAIEPLIELYKGEPPDTRVKAGAALGLGWLGKPLAVPTLISQLNLGIINEYAMEGLVKIGSPAVKRLIATFQDQSTDDFVKDRIREVLRQIGDPRASEILKAQK